MRREYIPKCQHCGSTLLQRNLFKIKEQWAQDLAKQIQSLTGQSRVFQRICPKCSSQEKVVKFTNGERI